MDELLRNFHDTVILLGGKPDIARLILCPDLVDQSALNALQQYNIELIESLKGRTAHLHKSEVLPASTENDTQSSHTTPS
jgi:hypothetical protein